jgi:hypothetical protein
MMKKDANGRDKPGHDEDLSKGDDRFNFQTADVEPSLRTNGSRECAPDDRLREAIHLAAQRKNGLLRRFRLRSLSYGGQVAPRNDGDRATSPESAISRLAYFAASSRRRAQGDRYAKKAVVRSTSQ